MNNKQLQELMLQTSYLFGGYKLIVNKIRKCDDYEEVIPGKLRIDAAIVLQQIESNLKIMEDIICPDKDES